MAYTVVQVSRDWPAAAQYTASGDTDILFKAPTGRPMAWVVSATKPAQSPGLFPEVASGSDRALTLLDGESLWLACTSVTQGGTQSVVIVE